MKQKTPDIRSQFGFHSTPFTREIQADHHFRGPSYDTEIEALTRVVENRQCGALIAPAGTGKTALLHGLMARLPGARYNVRYVKETTLSRRDLCREIALATGCKPAGNYPALVRRVQERFRDLTDSDGIRPVLLIDEAHELRPSSLGLLKVITNFDMDSRLVLCVLLIGQPALRQTLQRAELEDVARRLVHIGSLELLSRADSRSYIEHRCTIAGASSAPFDEGAFEALFELSRGNLRALDRLALRSLQITVKKRRKFVESVDVIEARKDVWA